jgi:peptide/nickel transport system permease protein
MLRYILTRVGQGAFVLLGVATVTFFVLRLIPGDPARVIAPTASAEDLARLRTELGLDRSLLEQFGSFLGDIFRGDLGQSYFSAASGSGSVFELIFSKLPYTMMLATFAMALAVLVALPLGMLAGAKRGRMADRFVLGLSVVFQSMPNFWVGLMLIQFVAINFALLPATGYGGVKSLILPAIALALPLVAVLARTIRATLGDALERDYALALLARGIPYGRVVVRHGIRAVAVPLLTVIGVQIGYLLGGAVVIEYLFDFPGVGLLTISAVVRRDYPLIQGIVLVLATIFVLVNLIVDLLYLAIDPRIRRQATAQV